MAEAKDWLTFVYFSYTLEAAHGKRTVQLAVVPDAVEPKAGPGRGHKTPRPTAENAADKTCHHDEGMFLPPATAERLRAINRAPDVVKDAYREGRISLGSS